MAKPLYEDDISAPTLEEARTQADRRYAGALTDAGMWTASTSYTRGQQYTDPFGQRRDVITAYTSGSTFGATDTAATVASSPSVFVSNSMTPLYAPKGNELYKWQTALAKAVTGGVQARINCYGDSVTAGLGSTTPMQNTNGFVGRLRTKFANAYGSTGPGIIWLEQYSINDYTGLTLTGGYTTPGTVGPWSTSGRASSSVSDSITLTGVTCDSIRIIWRRWASGGSFEYQVDGGAWTTVNTSGTNNVQITTISGLSLASHSLVIRPVSGAGTIYAIDPIDSTGKVRVGRIGRNGAIASQLAASGDAGGGAVQVAFATGVVPDLSVIFYGLNDFFGGVTQAAYETALTTLVSTAKAQGSSVILVTPYGVGANQASDPSLFARSCYRVADAQNCAVFDLGRLWRAGNGANGLIGADGTHPTDAGCEFIAARLYAAINLT